MMVFPFLLAVLPLTGGAAERQLGPHVHGQAQVDVSVDAGSMDVQVSLPGHDAVGFEHPPGSPQESAAIERATQLLKDAAWLVPAPAANCTLALARISPHGFGGNAEPGGHADFDASYHFICGRSARLDQLDIRLAAAFPAVQKLVVRIITAAGSDQQELDGTASHVDVQP
ncbi:MAG: DUF2796 domain-containing protein [Luteibacter sp.]